VTKNLILNPRGRATSGTVLSPEGIAPLVAGFQPETGATAWQSPGRSYVGGASIAIVWGEVSPPVVGTRMTSTSLGTSPTLTTSA